MLIDLPGPTDLVPFLPFTYIGIKKWPQLFFDHLWVLFFETHDVVLTVGVKHDWLTVFTDFINCLVYRKFTPHGSSNLIYDVSVLIERKSLQLLCSILILIQIKLVKGVFFSIELIVLMKVSKGVEIILVMIFLSYAWHAILFSLKLLLLSCLTCLQISKHFKFI